MESILIPYKVKYKQMKHINVSSRCEAVRRVTKSERTLPSAGRAEPLLAAAGGGAAGSTGPPET